RKVSTAMSAALTGEVPFFIHTSGSLRKWRMAMVPASRAASRISARSALVVSSSTGKGHPLDQQRRRGGPEIAVEIARRHHGHEHVLQVAGDGDFRDRIG